MPVQMIQQAYKFALDPTPRQARMLASQAGARRFTYNWALALILEAADARKAQKDAGIKPDIVIPRQMKQEYPKGNVFDIGIGVRLTQYMRTAVGCRRCRAPLAEDAGGTWVSRDGSATCRGRDRKQDEAPHERTIVTCARCCGHLAEHADGTWRDTAGRAACGERDGGHELSSEFLGWLSGVSRMTLDAAIRDADTAERRHLSGKARRPRFKKKGKCQESFQTHGPGVRLDSAIKLTLPKIGTVTVMSDDSMHPAMARSRRRAAPGKTRHKGNRRRSRMLWRHLRQAGPKAAELGPLLRQAREDTRLGSAEALKALNAEADARARAAAAERAVVLRAEAETALAAAEAIEDETARKEAVRTARKRIETAERKAADAPQATASRTDAWSEKKLARLERAGAVTLDQADVICSAYALTGEVRDRVIALGAQARIVRATVSLGADGIWWCSVGAEVPMRVRTSPTARQRGIPVCSPQSWEPRARRRGGGVAGIDFGVRELATVSDGTVIPNPRYLEDALHELRVAQRALSRCGKDSRRREKARRRVGLIHADVARLREQEMHRAATALVRSYEVIGMEGWNVQQVMSRGSADLPRRVRKKMNRRMADASIGMGRQFIAYKAPRNGATVLVTDPQEETNVTCCVDLRARTKPLKPHEELFTSDRCGCVRPRRENTARYVQGWAVRELSKRGPSQNGGLAEPRGGDEPAAVRGPGRSPVKRAASTRPRRGETGTPSG